MRRKRNLFSETEVVLVGGVVEVASESRRCRVAGGGQEIKEAEREEYRVCTGDLAHWEGEYLYYEGREDDMVKVLGKKVTFMIWEYFC